MRVERDVNLLKRLGLFRGQFSHLPAQVQQTGWRTHDPILAIQALSDWNKRNNEIWQFGWSLGDMGIPHDRNVRQAQAQPENFFPRKIRYIALNFQ